MAAHRSFTVLDGLWTGDVIVQVTVNSKSATVIEAAPWTIKVKIAGQTVNAGNVKGEPRCLRRLVIILHYVLCSCLSGGNPIRVG